MGAVAEQAPSNEVVVETRGLTKEFGRLRAVDRLTLQVRRGEVFGFLGPNGAGKSTTIRLLLGLVRPTAGQAFLLGLPVARRRLEIAPRVGALVEEPAFYDHLSAWRNLELFASLSGGAEREQIETVLGLVGLGDRARDKVSKYSHGMRQRLGLAAALLPAPELLILDEPASGLDPAGLADVRDLLRRLAHQQGVTVFLSSHLLHEVEQICTDVGVVSRGRLVARGKVDELLGSGEQRVRAEVDAPARALAIARELDFVRDPTADQHALELTVERRKAAQVNAVLVQAGISVYSLVPERMSLEDLYLRVMEENEHEGPVAG